MLSWLLSASFGLLWLIIAGRNAYDLWHAYRHQHSTSLTLFIGGVCGALAVISLPYPNTVYGCWLPMLFDVGCLPALWRLLRQ